MKEVITFIRENWKLILTCFLFLVELILICIKRKPKSLDDLKLAVSEAVALVPDLVNAVEVPGNGAAKKLKVENSCKAFVEKKLGRGLTFREFSILKAEVDAKIETVLISPTKKEISYEK